MNFDIFLQKLHQNLIVEDRWLQLLKGMNVTIQITVMAIILGTILGTTLAFMKMSSIKPFKWISSAYINIIRGTPTVIQLLIIYFGVFAAVNLDKVLIATIAFGLNSAAYIAEIVRAGVQAVDKGQIEAGRSLGLSGFSTMMNIVLPQAVKNILPTYANEFIVLIKETAIVGYIALEDLTKVGDVIRSRTFSPWIPLLTVALMYFLMTTVLARLFAVLERRLQRSDKG